MNKATLVVSLFLIVLITTPIQAQEVEALKKVDTFVSYLKAEDIVALAKQVNYPLKRTYPIPDIKNESEFILYFPTLFDSTFCASINNEKFSEANIIVRWDGIGIMHGLLWLNPEGKLLAVNYSSTAEKHLLASLNNAEKRKIHSSVNQWAEVRYYCKSSAGHTIKIDQLKDGTYRYASWNEGKSTTEKPDLVIQNGDLIYDGSAGNHYINFLKGDWTYRIFFMKVGPSFQSLGLSLILEQNGIEKARYKCSPIRY